MMDPKDGATLVLQHMLHNSKARVGLIYFGEALTCKDLMIEPLHQQASAEGVEPSYSRSMHTLTIKNGARAELFSGRQPDRLRGHGFTKAWILEGASHKTDPAVVTETMRTLRFCLLKAEDPEPLHTILVSLPAITDWQSLRSDADR